MLLIYFLVFTLTSAGYCAKSVMYDIMSLPLRGLLPVSLLGEQRHDGCEQFA